MAYLEWDKSLDTGINVIDQQHQRIVDYINRLQAAIESWDRDEISDVFQELIDYTETHFAFEESLQEQAGYEFLTGHQRIHQLFIKRLSGFHSRFEQGDPAAATEVSAMLRTWLINHIKTDDKDYVSVVQGTIRQEKKGGWLGKRLKKFFG
ncbi:hypothetical protein QQ73_10270 [Candidatus Endoriftia persephone str. Guaymas]|jgi:hemerythrin|uniref:Bacteriohemerythrin n=4 Tax=Gammaproteobacteria TaxID=1236 RepID=G2FD11_9GAMM|nr:bacteriohemerythrin [Candidatus Endoriftia persephone]MBA1331511.1 hypothetical protein [Candidatus Endoriftia persephone str. Guaymas]EGV50703.1 nitrogen assimilation regulatory protein ntrX [endosymbiont of Riftia pachyptila (vent Ph05)]EGW55391.1 bacteriohemerythrin [endosymbiont of Tevnia jerichonana (vent Tica)]KRT55945.1 hemerythrin-like metal-binding domain [endosymbiont of Ridgeia piscesae]KRT57619.1 hemerythrin [endosymbiont of Ridgeia piscesae]